MYKEILDDYTAFDPVRFLRDARHWEERRKELERELEEIPEIPSQSGGERVKSSNLSDLTVQTAIKRERILQKSERLVRAAEILDYGLRHLEDAERDVLERYYLTPKKTPEVVRYEIGEEHGKSERSVFRWISETAHKFGEIVVDHYDF